MSIFERNLAAIRLSSADIAAGIESQRERLGEPVSLGPYSIEPSRSGLPTAKYTNDESGESFFIHSPYDPQREAEQFVTQVLADSPEKNLTVIFGLGLGYQAVELAKRLPASQRIIVIEPHAELLYLALTHCDLTPLFTRQGLTLTTNAIANGRMLANLNNVELAALTGLRLVSNPIFDRLPLADSYKTSADRLRYEMMAVGGNLQTLMVMGEMQQMNVLLNYEAILDNPPFRNLENRFSGRPAIIISAGPSLEKNIQKLKDLEQHALLIAVDTATKPLIKAGVTPHIVVTGDPQEANARHLWGTNLPETYLVAEPQSPVSAIGGWTGPRFICTFHDNLMKWVDRTLGDRGRLRVWGSVAVMAYDCALRVGADPIVFVGQDLSFPGGRTYTSGTYFETEEKQEMTAENLKRRGEKLIEMSDIYGAPVLTNRQMFAYFNYLSDQFKHPDSLERTIINATEGGILQGPRVNVMSLDETVALYMTDTWEPGSVLKAAHTRGSERSLGPALADVERLLGELRNALGACRQGIVYVERTIESLQAKDGSLVSENDVEERFKAMSDIRLRMLRSPELMKIVEMANHAGIFAFTQGLQALARAAEAGEPKDHLRHCYHYHTLYASCQSAIERLIPLFEHCRTALQLRIEQRTALGSRQPSANQESPEVLAVS